MAVRILLVLGMLAVLSSCGQASSPAGKREKQGGAEEAQHKTEAQPKTVTPVRDQEEEPTTVVADDMPTTGQANGEARNSKPPTDGCLGRYRGAGSVQYSPDGQKIVFISAYYYVPDQASASATAAPGTKPSEADNEICVVNADGTGMVNLTDNSTDELYAAWSPDGTKIAFARSFHRSDYYDVDIFVMKADGSNETKIQDSADVTGLSWSPDGQEIAFGASKPNESGGTEIQTIRADGSGTPRRLTSEPVWQSSDAPDWSPDGKWIAFQSDRDTTRNSIGEAGDIYVMQVGDTHQWRQLTDGPFADNSPAWSPDGTEIAFIRTEGGTYIHKVNMDASKDTRLAAGGSQLWGGPTWSPDGKHIAYAGPDGGILRVDSDGSD